MKHWYCIFMLLFLSWRSVPAQMFSPVCPPQTFDYEPEALFEDPATGNLFIGGLFHNPTVNPDHGKAGFALYNGSAVTFPDTFLIGELSDFASFKGKVYTVGDIARDTPFQVYNACDLARFNGTHWECVSETDFNAQTNVHGYSQGLYVETDTLFLLGEFDSIGNPGNMVASHLAARWDGQTWYGYPRIPGVNPPNGSGTIWKAARYQGVMYFGGNIWNGDSLIDIIRYDHGWKSVGSGIPSTFAYVSDMLVYHNSLLVCGNFAEAWGDPATFLGSWNGTQWSNFANPAPDGRVTQLCLYQGDLYVAGEFSRIGNLTNLNGFANLVRWDGQTWHLVLETPNQLANMTPMGNDLIISGTFKEINGDPAMRYLCRYSPQTGIRPLAGAHMEVYPNPAEGGFFTALLPFPGMDVTLFSPDGREVVQSQIARQGQQVRISTEGWNPGIYLLRASAQDGTFVCQPVVVP